MSRDSAPPKDDGAGPFTAEIGFAALRHALALLCGVFGGPAALAALGWLPRGAHRSLCVWLRSCERFARRVLTLAAAAVPPGNAAPTAAKRGLRSSCGRAGFAHADPSQWSVSFAVTPSRAQRIVWRRRRTAAPRRVRSTMPLAIRLEALVRLAAAPERTVLRLARRLRAKPARIARTLDPGCSPPPNPVATLSRVALLTAYEAWPRALDTS